MQGNHAPEISANKIGERAASSAAAAGANMVFRYTISNIQAA